MLEMKLPENNPPLEAAISRYRQEQDALNELLSAQSPDNEQIREYLSLLAANLNDIHDLSTGHHQWRTDNANIYMNNYNFLNRIWTERFPIIRLFDGVVLQQMTPTVFQPVPVPGEETETQSGTIPLPAQRPQPPPIGVPLIQVEPPGLYTQAARVLLGLGGIALLLSGIATITVAGIKIAASFAAKEVAKKAAEELAKQLLIEAAIYGSASVGTFALGRSMVKRAMQIPVQQSTALVPA
jgi:hypothetical protein